MNILTVKCLILHFFLQNPEHCMRDSNQVSIKEALKAMVDHYRLKSGLDQTRIEAMWKQAMGPTIAGYTREIKLIREVLYIRIESGPLRHELSMGREKIRKMVNDGLGEEVVREVVLR